MKYFVLNPKVSVSFGNTGAYMVNFQYDAKMHIPTQESKLLKKLINGFPISNNSNNKMSSLLNKLIKNKYGTIKEKWNFVENYWEGPRWFNSSIDRIRLNRIFIELPTTCNKGCDYCHRLKYQGCFMCKFSDNTSCDNSIDYEYYKYLFKEINKVKPDDILLFGGNPFYEWNKTTELINMLVKSVSCSPSIFLIGPIDYFTIEKQSFCKNLGIKVILSLSNSAYKKINTVSGEVFYNIIYSDESKINNHCNLENKEDNVINKSIVIDKNMRMDINNRIAHNLPVQSMRMTFSEFFNQCAGNLTFTKAKKITLCPQCEFSIGMVDETVGLDQTLRLYQDSLATLWLYNASCISSCNRCEYKTDCLDCRALEYSLTGEALGKTFCKKFKEN